MSHSETESLSPPGRWEADAVCSDGGVVHIRPVRPEDAPDVEAFHERLSPESVYFRFFATMPRLRPRLLERFTHPRYPASVVLLALLGERVIGLAMFQTPKERSDQAEVAFAVEDAHHGRGIGTLLLEHLTAIARAAGIRRFTAETLPHNANMLRVFRDSGLDAERTREGGLVHLSFPLEPSERVRDAIAQREHQGEARSIERLLAPRSIAVVGATPRVGSIGHALYRNLKESNFRGALFPVHPKAERVLGDAAVRRVTDIGDEVDLAVVAVPAPRARTVLEDCAAAFVHGVVLISAGFAESGPEGESRQRELMLLRARTVRCCSHSSSTRRAGALSNMCRSNALSSHTKAAGNG